MFVSGLWLQDFRSYSDRVFQFAPGLNIYCAPNGTGKSNFVEALSLLSSGESWRARNIEESIRWNQELGRVKGKIQQQISGDVDDLDLEVILTRGSVQGKRTNKRLYRVEGVGKRREHFAGQLKTVLFTPEDMMVFSAGPATRRAMVDQFLSQSSLAYRQSLKVYEQALRRRNKLIDQLREGTTDRYAFFYWDQLLIEHGEVLTRHRQNFFQWLSHQAGITEEYQVQYDHSVMSEERLRQYAQAEVGAGYTLVGPHKDDWQILVRRGGEWRPLSVYGSRGEQRLALVWWKLAETRHLAQYEQEKPVILLDDVLSELDDQNSQYLLENLRSNQVFLTSAESTLSLSLDLSGASTIEG